MIHLIFCRWHLDFFALTSDTIASPFNWSFSARARKSSRFSSPDPDGQSQPLPHLSKDEDNLSFSSKEERADWCKDQLADFNVSIFRGQGDISKVSLRSELFSFQSSQSTHSFPSTKIAKFECIDWQPWNNFYKSFYFHFFIHNALQCLVKPNIDQQINNLLVSVEILWNLIVWFYGIWFSDFNIKITWNQQKSRTILLGGSFNASVPFHKQWKGLWRLYYFNGIFIAPKASAEGACILSKMGCY